MNNIVVNVEVLTSALGDPLPLNFYADDQSSLVVTPTSACLDPSNTEIFSLANAILSASDGIDGQSCSFSATLIVIDTSVVYTKLGVDFSSASPITPFTSSQSTFSANWEMVYPHLGATNVLTLSTEILFDKGDILVITAGRGTPFVSATACVSTDNTPLFLVTAQGSRLILSAVSALTSPFDCSASIIVGQTALANRNYDITLPAHGLSYILYPFLAFLDTAEEHVRMGVWGVAVPPTAPDTAENTMYLSIPASFVRAGDTVHFHFAEENNAEFASCNYRDGTLAGNILYYFLKDAAIRTTVSGRMTLAAPLQVNAENQVELFCPITVHNMGDNNPYIKALSVPGGLLATAPRWMAWFILDGKPLLKSRVTADVASYGPALNKFKVSAKAWSYGVYSYLEIDVSLRGVVFTDVADVESKCSFVKGTGIPMTPTGVTVVDGEARFRVTTQTILDNDSNIEITCIFSATVGATLVVYDHITNRPVASDTVHDGSLRITFGDGEQTHWMAADAVAAQHLVPFTLDAQSVYSATGAAKHEYTTVDIASTVYKMTPKAGVSSIALTCSAGGAKVSLSQKTFRTVDLVRYSASVLQTSLHVGPTALCSGAVVLAPFAVTGDPANLFMDVYMGEYVVFTLLSSISSILELSFMCFSRCTYFSRSL